MFYIACTRFTSETYAENIKYRNRHNEIVIYGSPLRIVNYVPLHAKIIVAEMNNTTNEIEGFGIILNQQVYKLHKIYKYTEFNRYIYRGNLWISKKQIEHYNPVLLQIFNNLLFKSKLNQKRRIGITMLSNKLFDYWKFDYEFTKASINYLLLQVQNEKQEKENKGNKSSSVI